LMNCVYQTNFLKSRNRKMMTQTESKKVYKQHRTPWLKSSSSSFIKHSNKMNKLYILGLVSSVLVSAQCGCNANDNNNNYNEEVMYNDYDNDFGVYQATPAVAPVVAPVAPVPVAAAPVAAESPSPVLGKKKCRHRRRHRRHGTKRHGTRRHGKGRHGKKHHRRRHHKSHVPAPTQSV
ncbi:hypothetical protein BB559_000124, partial [Furculomyces boomerangus]